jgi:ABC-type transporter Mla MlaB component
MHCGNGISGRGALAGQIPKLEIELMDGPLGCIALLRGDLLAETQVGPWSVEPILQNEVGVSLDLSGVTTIDSVGLGAILTLIASVQGSGRAISIGMRKGSISEAASLVCSDEQRRAHDIGRLSLRPLVQLAEPN